RSNVFPTPVPGEAHHVRPYRPSIIPLYHRRLPYSIGDRANRGEEERSIRCCSSQRGQIYPTYSVEPPPTPRGTVLYPYATYSPSSIISISCSSASLETSEYPLPLTPQPRIDRDSVLKWYSQVAPFGCHYCYPEIQILKIPNLIGYSRQTLTQALSFFFTIDSPRILKELMCTFPAAGLRICLRSFAATNFRTMIYMSHRTISPSILKMKMTVCFRFSGSPERNAILFLEIQVPQLTRTHLTN
ncbi:unnamed protein product, partial [Tuber aestivum]